MCECTKFEVLGPARVHGSDDHVCICDQKFHFKGYLWWKEYKYGYDYCLSKNHKCICSIEFNKKYHITKFTSRPGYILCKSNDHRCCCKLISQYLAVEFSNCKVEKHECCCKYSPCLGMTVPHIDCTIHGIKESPIYYREKLYLAERRKEDVDLIGAASSNGC
jgi:hypothetical protein